MKAVYNRTADRCSCSDPDQSSRREKWILLAMAFFLTMVFDLRMPQAQLGPTGFFLQGVLFDLDGQPLERRVNFRIQILVPDTECVLYDEMHVNQDLSQSFGAFSLELGRGFDRLNVADEDHQNELTDKVFRNDVRVSMNPEFCVEGFDPAADPENAPKYRSVRVRFNAGFGRITLSPDIKIKGSPYAQVASTLQGKVPSDFLQTNANPGHVLTQENLEEVFRVEQFSELMALLNGTSSSFSESGGNNFDLGGNLITDLGAPSASDHAANKGYVDGHIGGFDHSFGDLSPGDANKTITWSGTNWVVADPPDPSDRLPLAGGTMEGHIDMDGNLILGTGHITMMPESTLHLGSYTNTQEALLIASFASNPSVHRGKFWFNSEENMLRIWDGSDALSINMFTIAGGDLTGSYPNPQIAEGAVTDAKIASVSGEKVTGNIAGEAAGFTGTLGGDVTGIQGETRVVSLQGRPVEDSVPSAGDTLRWNSMEARWEPQAIPAAPVSSVAGRTGEVVLSTADITGAGTMISENAADFLRAASNLSDLTNPGVARGHLGLGSAATADIGSSGGNLVALEGSGRLPASVMPLSMGSVQEVLTGTGLSGGPIVSTGTISIANGGVDTLQMANGAVTTVKIANGAVTTDKIAPQAVTTTRMLPTNPGPNRLLATDSSTGATVAAFNCAIGQMLRWGGSGWECFTDPGTGVSAGTYRSVTVDSMGRVTAGSNPTTLSGYGITDAVPTSRSIATGTGLSGGGNLSGNRTLSFDTSWGDGRYVRASGGTVTGNLWFTGGVRHIGTSDDNDFRIRTNGSNRLSITSGGNVGIGTTSPSERLQVSGNIVASGNITGNRVYTNDVGGERWCRADTAGRIRCDQSAPSGGGCEYRLARRQCGGSTCNANCPSGYTRVSNANVSSYAYWTAVALCRRC